MARSTESDGRRGKKWKEKEKDGDKSDLQD